MSIWELKLAYHEQIKHLVWLTNGEHCFHDNVSQLVSQLLLQLRPQRSPCKAPEEFPVVGLCILLKLLNELQRGFFGYLKPLHALKGRQKNVNKVP